jgi:hypothetical protein
VAAVRVLFKSALRGVASKQLHQTSGGSSCVRLHGYVEFAANSPQPPSLNSSTVAHAAQLLALVTPITRMI